MASLTVFPDELLFQLLTFVDDTDLQSVSQTSHRLRRLSTDAILWHHIHHRNTARVRHLLTSSARPSRELLASRNILLGVAIVDKLRQGSYIYGPQCARSFELMSRFSRSMIRAKLNRGLKRRPPLEDLVSKNVVPRELVIHCPRAEVGSLYGAGERASLEAPDWAYLHKGMSPSLLPRVNTLRKALFRDALSRHLHNRPTMEQMRENGLMKTQHIARGAPISPTLIQRQLKLSALLNNLSLSRVFPKRDFFAK
ncbi:hypothetical protein BC937DRAFT_89490 [Endogone sp. FLAS-F59071]|nr:hypothetical protein BC937DRAFT_89490 [Endogone sp. FLAS-F59071]|eukprot:RUS22370.1 hypothetical protein BC937DRAFT_89490 [Endogone sp. FLAS-F59071]